jgi:hypothetical protein
LFKTRPRTGAGAARETVSGADKVKILQMPVVKPLHKYLKRQLKRVMD